MDFPLPNDTFDGRTVVASGIVNDDIAMLILMNREAPYFSVVETDLAWRARIVSETRYRNIVPAVVDYESRGGFHGGLIDLASNAEFGEGDMLNMEQA